MQQFEIDYAKMIYDVMTKGVEKTGRNGVTRSIFGMSLVIEDVSKYFPIIQGRKMYIKGILGEFAALIRQPKHLDDFTKWGCNYWSKWANADGSINVDYGNAWFDMQGFNQIAHLKHLLATSPNDRRMIVSGWRPWAIADLSLPCCHYSYQFNVSEGRLNMVWTQRSLDLMIGTPSDIVLAAVWLITLANEFGLVPGRIKMDFGDCHVYEEHFEAAEKYLSRVRLNESLNSHFQPVSYALLMLPGQDFCTFEPDELAFTTPYLSFEAIPLELKA